jgi:hypothetical protein
MAKTFLLAILLLTLTLSGTAFSPTGAGLRRSDIVEEKPGGARICGFLRKSEIVELLKHSGFGN